MMHIDRSRLNDTATNRSGQLFPSGFAKGGRSRSPLRYPGGKSRAVDIILQYIPNDVSKLCSPFVGGASVEIACASKGIDVKGYDIFSPLVDFWQCALEDSDKLAELAAEYMPLSREEFYALQKSHTTLEDSWQRAAAFFVLNRASFSGVTLSGGMSIGHPRFTPSSIQKLRDFEVKNLSVEQKDFQGSIKENRNSFLYLDPPYLNGQKLYGLKGNTHEGFEHESLRDMLIKRDGWILSYNDSPVIRDWYKNYKIINPHWQYGMGSAKKSKEVLILSHDLKAAA